MSDRPMLLQAALNGPFTKNDHAAMPETLSELQRDATECVAAGARAIHLHPRDAAGLERLDAGVVNEVASAVHEACGVPVGVTTGAWIEPDLERRVRLIRAWRRPAYASVNLSEEGAARVMAALLDGDVGVEAGISTIEDVQRLADSGLSHQITRVLVEPVDVHRGDAVDIVSAIHHALDALGVSAPRLQHGDGDATWILLTDAVRRGLDTRIGLEDTLVGPDGEGVSGNSALVRAAVALGAGGSYAAGSSASGE